jgi:hypothetical protein
MLKLEELIEICHKNLAEVIEWLYAHDEHNFMCVREYKNDYTVYVGDQWSADCIVIEIENGVVARWYRQGDRD